MMAIRTSTMWYLTTRSYPTDTTFVSSKFLDGKLVNEKEVMIKGKGWNQIADLLSQLGIELEKIRHNIGGND